MSKNTNNTKNNFKTHTYTNEELEKIKKDRQENNKRIRKYRIIVAILAILSIVVVANYMIESIAQANSTYQVSFFAKHFALGLSMILVGGIAVMLPVIQSLNNKFQEGKGDQLLVMIAFILFLAGLLAIGGSFLGFF